ncbi:MAG: hypothetical protein ACRDAM_14445, partial [Casimicrobium sp.]
CYEFLGSLEASDDEIFKPSNLKADSVLDLIDHAIAEIQSATSISPTERKRIEGYLHEAKKQASSTSPSWPKIVGALVIVAAVTSGIADAPNATKNIKEAIEYILGTSVEPPTQRRLAPALESEPPPAPIGTFA